MIFIVRNKVIIKVRYTEGNLDVSCGDGSECGNAVRDAVRAYKSASLKISSILSLSFSNFCERHKLEQKVCYNIYGY